MEELNNYWHLMPDQNANVHSEIVDFLKSPQVHSTNTLKECTEQYFVQNIKDNPYPTLNILKLLPPNISSPIAYQCLVKFSKYLIARKEDESIHENDKQRKILFVTLLSHINYTEKYLLKINENIFPIILDNELNTDKDFYLSWLSGKCNSTLSNYLEYKSANALQFLSKDAIYTMAVNRKRHFLEELILNDNYQHFNSNDLEQITLIIQIISKHDISKYGNFHFEDFNENSTVSYLLLEIKRLHNLKQFLSDYNCEEAANFNVIKAVEKYSVIDILYKHLDLNSSISDSIRNILLENEQCNLKIFQNVPKQQTQCSERELFDKFLITNAFLDIIMFDHTAINDSSNVSFDLLVDIKIKEVHKYFRDIKTVSNFNEVISIVFCLIFLRWEHCDLVAEKKEDLDRTVESGSEESDAVVIQHRRQSKKFEKYGFVCNVHSMEEILKFLKYAISKKKHSDVFAAATDVDKAKLTELSDTVADAIWRFNLFKSTDGGKMNNKLESIESKKMLLLHNFNEPKKTSSDDDDYGGIVVAGVPPGPDHILKRQTKKEQIKNKNITVIRRKPRKRLIASFKHSDDEHRRNSDGVLMQRSLSSSTDKMCIVSKMLGTTEHIIAVCMNKGDLEQTKQIIKNNCLEDSSLAAELKFTCNFSYAKEKLQTMFISKVDDLNKQEQSRLSLSTSPQSTQSAMVERIKKVATIGFETSKITNIIGRFARENELQQSTETANLVEKFKSNFTFLNYYLDHRLQTTIIVDFVTSLANRYDHCLNIFNMIKTQYTQALDSNMYQIGYYNFMINLCDCLQLHKQIMDEEISVRNLLSNKCYSLNPCEYSNQLTKEKLFKTLTEINANELDTLDKLKPFIKQFDLIKASKSPNFYIRIYYYLLHLNRLVQMLPNNSCTPSELMQSDLFFIIGRLIFDENVSPSDIESIVCNLNVNLMYVLCHNLSSLNWLHGLESDDDLYQSIQNLENGNFMTPFKKPRNNVFTMKEQQHHLIFDYMKKHNQMIAYIIKEANSITNDEILYEHKYISNLMKLSTELSIIYSRNLMTAILNRDHCQIQQVCQYICQTQNLRQAFIVLTNTTNASNTILLGKLKTWLIRELSKFPANIIDLHLIEHTYDINTKANILLENLEKLNDYAISAIKSLLLHKHIGKMNPQYRKQLQQWLDDITIYTEICVKGTPQQSRSWLEIMKTSQTNPEQVLKILLELKEYEICLKWCEIHKLHESRQQLSQFYEIFTKVLQSISSFSGNEKLFQLIERFPDTIAIYNNLLDYIRNAKILQYIIEYLQKHTGNKPIYQQFQMSLILHQHQHVYGDEYIGNSIWQLMSMPLVIMEQYLMNSKFELFGIVLNSFRSLLVEGKCDHCVRAFDGDMHRYTSMKLLNRFSDSTKSSNDLGHTAFYVSQYCIDSLLRVYADKALDFRVIELTSSREFMSTATDLSLDSLCDTFIMPKEPVKRDQWIRDDEALHCMCCKRAIFTMLTRRHHCRQCGRVVCHACSINRLTIPSLYANVSVRVCDDCSKQIETQNALDRGLCDESKPTVSLDSPNNETSSICSNEWQFSGNTQHDELLREEFSYEYAPSVSLCLSILAYHSRGNPDGAANFLIHHCGKFEHLLRPLQPGYSNPEIDYGLVTKMLHCLALAAKMRGGPPECNVILEHAEVFRSIVQNRCESLLPMDAPSRTSFRKLRDSLVIAEKWCLALEISLKCGFPTTGVMAAWGISCLRSGSFDTAREKFLHCMTKTGSESDLSKILNVISYESSHDVINNAKDNPKIKRPPKSPPLLADIIQILEATCYPTQANIMERVNIIKNSNTSLASSKTIKHCKENIPLHEPALNILHTLGNLTSIAEHGTLRHSRESLHSTANVQAILKERNVSKINLSPKFYDECIYYLTHYGNHNDIVSFLVKHNQIVTVLKYFIYQNVDSEIFIHIFFMPHFKTGKVNEIINGMVELDETLVHWQQHIIQLCSYLERNGLLNCLYHIQILCKDPVRASMTCVRFYSMDSKCYTDLQTNSIHLLNAQKHLQMELELCQWEEIKVQGNNGGADYEDHKTLLMKIDSRTLNSHINTVWRQIEVTKFLSKCEQDGRDTVKLLPKICLNSSPLPTLFGNAQDKIQVTVLTLVCGSNIEEGFGLAFRIIQDFNLTILKVYGLTAKYLAGYNRLACIKQLISCIASNSESADDKNLCDELLSLAIKTAVATTHSPYSSQMKMTIDDLIQLINDISIKIHCHITSGQLKSAYLLAVQHSRFNDIKKILRQAELTNQIHIKRLCEKKLNINH